MNMRAHRNPSVYGGSINPTMESKIIKKIEANYAVFELALAKALFTNAANDLRDAHRKADGLSSGIPSRKMTPEVEQAYFYAVKDARGELSLLNRDRQLYRGLGKHINKQDIVFEGRRAWIFYFVPLPPNSVFCRHVITGAFVHEKNGFPTAMFSVATEDSRIIHNIPATHPDIQLVLLQPASHIGTEAACQ